MNVDLNLLYFDKFFEEDSDDDAMHYGTPRHSGRYPWGSGEDPYQHESSFLAQYNEYKKAGMKETEIAEAFEMSTTELRARKARIKSEQRAALYSQAVALKAQGMSNSKIAEQLGMAGESSVRALLDEASKIRQDQLINTAESLKKNVEDSKYIDLGPGCENILGVNRTKMNAAVQYLVDEGYTVHYIKVEQLGSPGKYTTVKVLAAPDTGYSEVYKNRDQIRLPGISYDDDGTRTPRGILPPTSVDSSRIFIRYGSEGGKELDGTIELRRGVEDISLGNASYAQVRIAVDGNKYMKGMALYSENIPKGYDIVYNSHYERGEKIFKDMKTNPDGSINMANPFGASLKMEDGIIVGQREYTAADGSKQLSAINIIREEGDWDTWSKNLASQMWSKQMPALAQRQLDISYKNTVDEFNDVLKLTNPEVKVKMLEEFADGCDSKAVSLKAASLPRQSSKVLIPVADLKDDECYCPTLRNGEKVVCIRYPHGGTFEIPTLTVNNKNKSAIDILGPSTLDAIGINSKVAQRLSGADFDGDTVIVIPIANQKIKTSNELPGLKGFDPQEQYKGYPGLPKMSDRTKQTEMGKITNLITDMTIKGATEDELARAVRHSMVIIDAQKHELNYKQSYIDNGIAELKKKYQGGENKGASTLISQASSEQRVGYRKEKALSKMTDEEKSRYFNGEVIWEYTGDTYQKAKKNKSGEITGYSTKEKQLSSTKMYEAKDAKALSSGTKIENIAADYANKMKALANEARKEARATKPSRYSPEAKARYSEEVNSLNEKLKIALANKPYERQAQLFANVYVAQQLKDNPDMSAEDKKKLKSQALAGQRARTGAHKTTIDITPTEWEAIQAGAISSSKLKSILDNADDESVKKYATPKEGNTVPASKKNRIKSLSNMGYTIAEIADQLGVSTGTVSNVITE